MKFVGILRAATLCCLAVGLSGPSGSCASVEPASTMKDMLDFLDKLYDSSSMRNKVYANIEKKAAQYCDYGRSLDTSHYDMFFNGHVHEVLENLHRIREKLVKTPSDYGKYTALQLSEVNVEEYAESIATYFPQLYSALYYLHFNVSEGYCHAMKGGKWNDHKLSESNDLSNWLTDKIDNGRSTELIKRGFNAEDLHGTSSGHDVASAILYAVSNYLGGSLQKALSDMLFLGPWHDAKTAHSILFLDEFCSYVTNDKLNDQFTKKYAVEKYEKFQDIWFGLRRRLEAFANNTNLDIFPVCRSNRSFYMGLFKKDAFEAYVEWMEENIPNIKKSMEKMFEESSNWRESNLKNATSAGPFKYGFVFKDGWDESTLVKKLEEPTRELTTHWYSISHLLTELQTLNRKIPPSLRHTPLTDTVKGASTPTGFVKVGDKPADVKDRVLTPAVDSTLKPSKSDKTSEDTSSSATMASSIVCFTALGLLVSVI